MTSKEETLFFKGGAGTIEALLDRPSDSAPIRGIALVAHPHPLFGGANTNKVAQTLARTFARLGYLAIRPNFRGVGMSAGEHDNGLGETDDLLSVLDEAKRVYGELPVALAGFSFGSYVQTRVAHALRAAACPPERVVLVALAAGLVEGARHYAPLPVATDSLVIHGSADELVSLASVLAWAEPQNLPVTVIAGADHFFHRRLHLLRDIVLHYWREPKGSQKS